jgi:hypothetical protein
MKVAHVRERHAPAGSPWRLVAALDDGETPAEWLDLEVARRRAAAADPGLAHNASLYPAAADRPSTITSRAARVSSRCASSSKAFARREEEDDAVIDAASLAFGPPVLRPPSLRDFYAFEGHVRTMWERRGGEVPETGTGCRSSTSATSPRCRGPDDPIWSPAASHELDYELEVAAVVDTPARDLPPERAEEAIGGYTIFNDWSARDLQREETVVRLGAGQGQGLRELLRTVAGHPRRARRRPCRERLRPRHDGRSQRRRDEPRPAGPTHSSRSARCSPGRRPTCSYGRAI